MPQRQNNWYNLQGTRRYPLDDKATGTGDDGTRLPQDTLVDCHLRFPLTLGRYAYLSGLTITPTLVTAVFTATDSVVGPTSFVPLCAVTLTRPVDEYRHYAVEPLAPGVGGFVVFGDVSENVVWRASNPEQGLLAPRTGRGYTPLPIPTLRKLMERQGLENLVTLEAGVDLEIVKERIPIAGVGLRQAIVFRLLQTTGAESVLKKYLGPCDNRPESRTCNLEPIESINGISPDCNGNINIVYAGIARGPYESCGGETLDLPVGLGEVCDALPRTITDRFTGRDLCAVQSSSLSSSESLSSTSFSSVVSVSSVSSSETPCASLPFCQNFDNEEAPFFVINIGEFAFEPFDSPAEVCSISSSYLSCDSGMSGSSECVPVTGMFPMYSPEEWSLAATDGSRRNVILWDACAYASAESKKVTTDLQLTSLTAQRNGGIIINYRLTDLLTNPHIEYFHALLDQPTKRLRLMHFNGAVLNEIAGVTLPSNIVLEHWYRMMVETIPSGLQTLIRITVSGITNPGWAATVMTVPTNDFQPDDGLFGLGTDRAHTRFSFFQAEEL